MSFYLIFGLNWGQINFVNAWYIHYYSVVPTKYTLALCQDGLLLRDTPRVSSQGHSVGRLVSFQTLYFMY